MNEYNIIFDNLEQVFLSRQKLSIQELLSYNEVNVFNSEKVIALIKLLISYDKIHILDSENKKFMDYVIQWNTLKKIADLPQIKKLYFDSTEICLSLPPFDKFGLIDFYRDKNMNAKTLKSQFYSLFNEAKKSIKICSPFLEWNGFTYFQDVLLSKAQQNVKIEILSREISSSENNRRFEEFRKIYDCFKSKNLENNLFIRNYYYRTENKKLASSIHAKIIIIDNIKAYVGSGELRKNSLEKIFELGLIVSGEKVTELKNIFKGIFARAEEVNLE